MSQPRGGVESIQLCVCVFNLNELIFKRPLRCCVYSALNKTIDKYYRLSNNINDEQVELWVRLAARLAY